MGNQIIKYCSLIIISIIISIVFLKWIEVYSWTKTQEITSYYGGSGTSTVTVDRYKTGIIYRSNK